MLKKNNSMFAIILIGVAVSATPGRAIADTFGSGEHQFTMDFVNITGGSVADDTGYGAVDHDYRMGMHEVSRRMIFAYNALSGGPEIRLSIGPGLNYAGWSSWNEAARFVNWLNESKGFAPAYNFTTDGVHDNITLWTAADGNAYDPANPFRNPSANYFLPSEDEWYRAAYYDPGAGVYWDYATGSNTPPTPTPGGGGTAPGTAAFLGPAEIRNAGGLSPFGTMAQNGNVEEWTESGYMAPNDSGGEDRVVRGGSFINGPEWGRASLRVSYPPPTSGDAPFTGFRVASVPEPSGLVLVLGGGIWAMLRRRRG